MGKIYYLFLTMLFSLVGMTANAQDINVTINVDAASRVGVQIYSSSTSQLEEQVVQTGENSYTMAANAQLRIYSKSGALLSTIENVTLGCDAQTGYKTEFTDTPSSNVTYKVTSVLEDDVYTCSIVLTVDNAAKVSARLLSSGRFLTLCDGANIIKFDPLTETQLMITNNGGKQIYNVTCNDEPVTPQGTQFIVGLADGMSVIVEAEWPDMPTNAAFVFADEDSKGFITGVTVNGEPKPIDDVKKFGFSAQSYDLICVYANTKDYALDEFTVNGVETSFENGEYNFYITNDVILGVKAHKYGNIEFKLVVEDPETVTVYDGSENDNKPFTLVAGENKLSVSEGGNKTLTIIANDGCYLASVNDGTQDLLVSNGSCSVNNVNSDMVITIKSGKIVRDKKLVYYIDDISSLTSWSSKRADNTDLYLNNGYNEVLFYDGDLPISISTSGAPAMYVYLDDKQVEPNNQGSTTYYLSDITDGSVLKVFVASESVPTQNAVTFNLSGENLTAEDVTVTYDRVKTLSNLTAGLSAFAGTEVSIVANNDKVIAVKVNDEAVTAIEGVFTFTVGAATTVEISDVTPTGFNSINALNAENAIYTLQGVKVVGKAKGLYIKNSKKFVVK